MLAHNIDQAVTRILPATEQERHNPIPRDGNVGRVRAVRPRMTGHHLTTIAALAALLAIAGCDPELATTNTEFRGVSQVDDWDEVRCMTNGGTSRCYATTPDATDFWIPVVSHCELQGKLATGEFFSTADEWMYFCDYLGAPVSFADVQCFHINAAEVECYGGDGSGWLTEVEPECVADRFTEPVDPEWPEDACALGTSISTYHNFDGIYTVLGGTPWWGRAVNNGDAFFGVPSCRLPTTYPAGDPLDC